MIPDPASKPPDVGDSGGRSIRISTGPAQLAACHPSNPPPARSDAMAHKKLFQKWVPASKTPGKQALRLVFETVSKRSGLACNASPGVGANPRERRRGAAGELLGP